MTKLRKFKKDLLEVIADLESIALRVAVFLLFCYGVWRVLR